MNCISNNELGIYNNNEILNFNTRLALIAYLFILQRYSQFNTISKTVRAKIR